MEAMASRYERLAMISHGIEDGNEFKIRILLRLGGPSAQPMEANVGDIKITNTNAKIYGYLK